MPINQFNHDAGLGFSSGDPLVMEPFYTNGNVYYVDSVNGSDSNSGVDVNHPKATLGAVVALIVSGDIIVLFPDYDETLTAGIELLVPVTIVGAGTSGGQPTATLRLNAASSELLELNSSRVELRNIRFPTNIQSNDTVKIVVGNTPLGPDCLIKGCRFEASANDTAQMDLINADRIRVEDCTFVVTGTVIGTQSGLSISDSSLARGVFTNLIFDGGTAGWGGSSGFIGGASTLSFTKVEGMQLVNGSGASFTLASSGRLNINSTNDGRTVFV